jgi:hypothetical protein
MMRILARCFVDFSVVAILSLTTMQVGAIDLSGNWIGSNVGANLVQNGQTVEGYYTSLTTDLQEKYGFNIGDKMIYGTFDGVTYQGKTLLHFPVDYKHCENWAIWCDVTLTLSSDGNTLSGTATCPATTMYSDCSLDYNIGTTSMYLTREVKVTTVDTTCPSATPVSILSDLSIYIPDAVYTGPFGDMRLWATLQPVPSADGSLMWKLSDYGINP